MTSFQPPKSPLCGGIRFISFWCWLSVALCVVELLSALLGIEELAISAKPNAIPSIILSGLALYVALGIKARANSARLVLIVILVSGAVGMVLFPLAYGVGILLHEGLPHGARLLSGIILFLFVPTLLVFLYSGLLKDVTSKETRKQFTYLGENPNLLSSELRKENTAIYFGIVFGIIATVLNFYWRQW